MISAIADWDLVIPARRTAFLTMGGSFTPVAVLVASDGVIIIGRGFRCYLWGSQRIVGKLIGRSQIGIVITGERFLREFSLPVIPARHIAIMEQEHATAV